MGRESPSKVCVDIMNNVKKEYERMFGELSSDDRGSIPVWKVTSSGNICVDGKECFVMNGPYDKIVRELRDTYIAKNADYGNSFEKSIDEFGVISAIVRMSDKMERLKSLTASIMTGFFLNLTVPNLLL